MSNLTLNRHTELRKLLERLSLGAMAATFADLALKAAKEGLTHLVAPGVDATDKQVRDARVQVDAASAAVEQYRTQSGVSVPDDDYRGFEVGGVYAKDKQAIVEVTAEGEIGEMERQVVAADVPPVVSAALKAKMPRFQATAHGNWNCMHSFWTLARRLIG